MKVRTRFAPSPTGYLHVGGLRTALYNYLYAKKNNGKFILRIEDTDQNRLVDCGTENLIEILTKLGLDYDFGPNKEDECGPYIQSKRLNIYKKYYMDLIKNKSAYACFVEKDELNPEYNIEKALERINNENFVVKLKVKSNSSINLNDLVRGNIEFDLNLIEDPIIIKSDGYPTYHFANVVDDHLMKITHVIRGEEWISSLPKHIILYHAFGWDPPEFCHLPLLLNPDKSKLSKRQGDVSVEDFLTDGYLKDTLINFVSLLGWHPKDNQEIFDLQELISLFSLNRINKSGAIFDREKLKWMNKEYIKSIDSNNFQNILTGLLENKKIKKSNIDIKKISHYCQNRINQLNQIWDEIYFFYYSPEIKIKELEKFKYKKLFKLWISELKSINGVSDSNIKSIVSKSKDSLQIFGKNLFFPLRIVLIGQTHGPDLLTIIDILGIKETIKRLQTKK